MIYRVFMTDEDYVVIDADSPEEAMLKLRDAARSRAQPGAKGRGGAAERLSFSQSSENGLYSCRTRVIASALKSLGFPKTF